ncbi:MAG: hypothetical protein ACOYI5_07945 [Christensenellales bacterium]
MKAIHRFIPAMFAASALAPAARAEGGADGALITWDSLLTIGGATAATLLIVQYLKTPLDRVWKIPTRALVYVIALALLLAAAAFTIGITLEGAILSILNAVLVSTSAYGAYEVTFKRLE